MSLADCEHGYIAESCAFCAATRVLTADRDRWIRLFNRLEAAVSHHKKGKDGADDGVDISDEWDADLWAARDRVLSDAAQSSSGS